MCVLQVTVKSKACRAKANHKRVHCSSTNPPSERCICVFHLEQHERARQTFNPWPLKSPTGASLMSTNRDSVAFQNSRPVPSEPLQTLSKDQPPWDTWNARRPLSQRHHRQLTVSVRLRPCFLKSSVDKLHSESGLKNLETTTLQLK